MKIVNVTHGSSYAIGGYAAAALAAAWLARGYPPMLSYVVLVVAAIVVAAPFALFIERAIVRYLYARDELVILLATYALFLILEDVVKLIWGVNPYYIAQPYALLGSFQVAGMAYPTYNLVLVAAAIFFGGGLAWLLHGTRAGKLLVAVIHDPEVSRAMGVNVGRHYLAVFVMTAASARGLVALGLLLRLRTGLGSFGQALFYCLGAYSAGALGRFFGISAIFVEMLVGGAVAAAIALVLGFLLARYRGIFFGLLSLALSMILYGLLVKTEALGSTDGFNILPSTLFGARPGPDSVRSPVLLSAAGVASVAALLVHRYLQTPLGRLAPPIKDNEIRVEYMGASARHAVHVKYVIAAALAGIGAALAATTVGHIDPEMAYWTTSGQVIFIAILAGTGNVIAPFVGALIYGAIHTMAYDVSPNTWQMSLGAALLALIVFLPEGLWSIAGRLRAQWR